MMTPQYLVALGCLAAAFHTAKAKADPVESTVVVVQHTKLASSVTLPFNLTSTDSMLKVLRDDNAALDAAYADSLKKFNRSVPQDDVVQSLMRSERSDIQP